MSLTEGDGNGKLDRLELRLMCAHVSRNSRNVDIDERRLRARVMGWAPKIDVSTRDDDRYDWIVEKNRKEKEE